MTTSLLGSSVAVIDFEASSLDDDSYPIEVGIAVWHIDSSKIFVWSSLICPEREWRLYGHWSRRSQKIHGIKSDELSNAPSAKEVVSSLCLHLEGISTVFCDGGPYDAYWSQKLFVAANRACPFTLKDWHRMLMELPNTVREEVLQKMDQSKQKHRAADDAAVLLSSLAQASKQNGGEFVLVREGQV